MAGSYSADKKQKLYHLDTWRLTDENELEELGLLQKISEGHVFSIEWANKVPGFLSKASENAIIIWIKIEHGSTEDERVITVSDYAN